MNSYRLIPTKQTQLRLAVDLWSKLDLTKERLSACYGSMITKRLIVEIALMRLLTDMDVELFLEEAKELIGGEDED